MKTLTAAILAFCCGLALCGGATAFAAERPNIVVVLVDDAGFMDFGGYGGEASTPVIDAIGDAGVRFSNYHTSPLCSPSRAMLLTGLDNHRTGVATIPEVITAEQKGRPGYALRFEAGVKTVAAKLQEVGYRTYITGKWHLGDRYEDLPNAHGFHRSFVLDASGADNFEQKSYMPYYNEAPWFEDGKPATLPEDFYSSAFIVDRMMRYIKEGDAGAPDEGESGDAPFFAFMPFQAIHIPIQAPKHFIDKYRGTYDMGWEKLREQRWNRAKQIGLIHPDAPLAPAPDMLDAWDALTDEQRRYYAKSMEVNAAMLEAMDFHIGRFVAFLRERGEYDNTLFIIASDNGPEFNNPGVQRAMQLWMALNDYNVDIETLGEPGSLAAIGPEWALAAATPGRLFKFYPTEGGLRVPLIIAGPGVQRKPGFDDASVFVTDLAPTMLDAANVPPDIAESGKSMDGESLWPVLGSGAAWQAQAEPRTFGMEVSGNAVLFRGDYKLMRATPPHGADRWMLFNIRLDPGETNDLSGAQPQLFEEMQRAYARYAERVGVIEVPAGFNPLAQIRDNTIARQLEFYGTELLISLVLIVVLLALIVYVLVRCLRWLWLRARGT